MSASSKILSYTVALLTLVIASVCGFAQDKVKHSAKKEHAVSVGFQTGRELLFNSSPLLHSKQSKIHYGVSKSLVLRKPLNTHFKVEAGLNYTSFQNTITSPSFFGKQNNSKPYIFSLPVTIQYYFLPEKCKVRPFCGAGIQCNMLQANNNPPSLTEVNPIPYNPQPDTKYITILFTQGVTFEINTKIEITQSIHFIPENTNSVIGIDLGIGFKLP